MDADEALQFVEYLADFIPQNQINDLSVVGREDIGDVVAFLDKKGTKNEDLWQALYAHLPSVDTPVDSICELTGNNCTAISGTKRKRCESTEIDEPLDLQLDSQPSLVASHCQEISTSGSSCNGTPEKKQKIEPQLPGREELVYDDLAAKDDDEAPVHERRMSFATQAPKSIMKSRPSGKKANVAFKDTVTLVTHSYVIEGDASRLDQSEENMSRFEYEAKGAPQDHETSLTDGSFNDASVSRELFASPYQYSSCAGDSGSATPSSDGHLAQPCEEVPSACDVKKVLFPHEESVAMTAAVPEAMVVSTDDMSLEPGDIGAEKAAESDSPALVESSFVASELDTSFLSESDLTDDMLMGALHESSSQPVSDSVTAPPRPVTVVASAPFAPPMSFYSQDLMLDSSPPNSSSQEETPLSRPALSAPTSTSVMPPPRTVAMPSAQSPGQALSIYQSFSQDSPSQPDQTRPAVTAGHAETVDSTGGDSNDPLQLKAWPAVIWARTKTFLPAPHLIRTSPSHGTIVYLVQKNFRFDDNLALQATMIASQSLQMPLVVVVSDPTAAILLNPCDRLPLLCR